MTAEDDFKCLRCGNCCRKIGGIETVTKKDVERWKKEGRKDILKYVGKEVKDIDDNTAYEFTAYPYISSFEEIKKRDPCVFLEQKSKKRYICKIHETKPTVCSEFPTIVGDTIHHHDYCNGIKRILRM